jgi:hypothetical protein
VTEPEPIIYQGRPCLSFMQLDRRAGVVKGTAFRAFKRVRGDLVEGVDFFYLDAEQERECIEDLRARGLIYPSTWNLVLLAEAGWRQLGKL